MIGPCGRCLEVAERVRTALEVAERDAADERRGALRPEGQADRTAQYVIGYLGAHLERLALELAEHGHSHAGGSR